MELLAGGIQKLELGLEKISNHVSRSKVKVKMSKLLITLSLIVTDIPIKPQQFPTSRFAVACCRFFAAVTLTLDP